MTESAYNDALNKASQFTIAELDEELERTARTSETCEMLLCCYLAAMRERGGFREFGDSNVYDYADARFGFGSRKTRYLVSLGQRIESLPKLREALASGKLGWCKAARVASVARPENEAMWLDSALSLSVRDLERRLRDGTDTLASEVHFRVNDEVRVLWENLLEIFRRRAGAEISPSEAFEYMVAESFAQYCHLMGDEEASPEDASPTEDVPVESENEVHEQRPLDSLTADSPTTDSPVFPWVEPIDTTRLEPGSLWTTEHDAENEFSRSSACNELRQLALERDGWRCSYPGCGARKNLEVHHIRFRSRGGPDAPWNLTVVCHFHHHSIHAGQVGLRGRAPIALEWTPPKLMREVIERRRNTPAKWVGELDIKEWTLDPAPVAT